MSCTTVLVGKKASNDGSTMIARNDDGFYDVKKLVVVPPEKQPRKYKSVFHILQLICLTIRCRIHAALMLI